VSAAAPDGALPREARAGVIEARLRDALSPSAMALVDDSEKHRGHAGAADGRSHFSLRIVSAAFYGMAPLARHRLVYAALGPLMATDIHALTIDALAPGEEGVAVG